MEEATDSKQNHMVTDHINENRYFCFVYNQESFCDVIIYAHL